MYCRKCGAQLRNSARFCGKCGAAIVRKDAAEPVPPKEPEPQTSETVRPAAPAPCQPEAAAASAPESVQPVAPLVKTIDEERSPSPSIPPAKHTRKPALLIAAAVVLAGIGISSAYYFLSSASESDTPSSAASSVQSPTESQSEAPSPAPNLPDTPAPLTMDAAYAEVVSNLQAKYGEGFYDDNGPHGVVVVRKFDFDQDGTDELLCAFYNDSYDPYSDDFENSPICDEQNCAYCFEVWGWQNEKVVKLTHSRLLGSMSVDDFDITLEYKDGSIYLIIGQGFLDESFNWAFTVEDGLWKCAMYLHDQYYLDDFGEIISSSYYAFDKPISDSEYASLAREFFDFQQYQMIPLYYGEDQLSVTDKVIQELQGISANSSNTLNQTTHLGGDYNLIDAPEIHSISSSDPLPNVQDAEYLCVDLDNDGTLEKFCISLDAPNGLLVLGIGNNIGYSFTNDLCSLMENNGFSPVDEWGEWDTTVFPIQIACFDWNQDGIKEVFIGSGDPAVGYANAYRYVQDANEPFEFLCSMSGKKLIYDENTMQIDSLIGSSNRIVESYSYSQK